MGDGGLLVCGNLLLTFDASALVCRFVLMKRYREDAKTDCARYFEEMSKWETDMKQIGRLDLIRKKSLYHHMATKASETDRSKDFHEPERAQVPT